MSSKHSKSAKKSAATTVNSSNQKRKQQKLERAKSHSSAIQPNSNNSNNDNVNVDDSENNVMSDDNSLANSNTITEEALQLGLEQAEERTANPKRKLNKLKTLKSSPQLKPKDREHAEVKLLSVQEVLNDTKTSFKNILELKYIEGGSAKQQENQIQFNTWRIKIMNIASMLGLASFIEDSSTDAFIAQKRTIEESGTITQRNRLIHATTIYTVLIEALSAQLLQKVQNSHEQYSAYSLMSRISQIFTADDSKSH